MSVHSWHQCRVGLQNSVVCARFALLVTTAVSHTVLAQSWPVRPIKLVVPAAVGTTSHAVSRLVANELGKRLGQPVVVIAKQGAGGTIAMAEVARAAPDGYTIAFATQGTLVFNTALYSAPGYDSLKDFAALALVGNVPNVMIVPASSRFNDLHDVIAAAKAEPGEITFSSGGSGTSQHLSGVLFAQFTGTQLLHVPYSAAPQALRAVMTGEVAMGFFNIPAVMAQIRSGNVKALAVTGRVRSPLLPEVPTLDELGLRGYDVNTWFGFVAPVAIRPEIVARLNREITSILALPKLKNDLVAQGMELAPPTSPAEFVKFIRDDTAKWIPIVRASGARAN